MQYLKKIDATQQHREMYYLVFVLLTVAKSHVAGTKERIQDLAYDTEERTVTMT